MADAAELARLMEPVARRLFGAPRETHRGGMEWRYGTNGSLKIEIDTGVWSDYETGHSGGTLDLVARKVGLPDQASAARWLEDEGYLPRRGNSGSQPDTVYRYRDQDGTLLLEVVRRYENGEKKFSQRAPDPASPDGWLRDEKGKLTVKGVKQVPYRLPELLQAIAEGKTIFFVEGEKDADRLWSLGLAATTNIGGAKEKPPKWLPELASFFAGADVVIIPDYDLVGQQHAENIAKILNGTAKRVRLLDLAALWPDVKIKNDVSDWLDGGGTAEALREHAEWLPTWAPPKTRAKVIQFPGGLRPPWFDQLGKTNTGRPVTDLHNVMTVLYVEPRLVDCFAFNEMLQVPMLMQELPMAPGCVARGPGPRPVAEDDIGCLQRWLQYQQIRSVGFETVRQAVELRAFDKRFHPVRDWLDGLEPEGSDDVLNSWLHDYFGCENNGYHRRIGRMFLIAMVARIYRPGCQADYMLVLEGPQGEVKSQACHVLAGEEYFSDGLPEVGGDPIRLSMHLRGKWLIEISELSSFSKADAALLKSFITRQVEIFIPKFGRMEKREPRQCLFVGTTNDDAYLKDETGGRRFWPVKCGTIDKDGLGRAREQLFAHAVERFHHGEQYWPDRAFEKETIAPQQAARLYQDAWLPPVKAWLDKQIIQSFTLIEIAEGAIPKFSAAQFSVGDQMRLGRVLRLCGWKSRHSMNGNVWETEQ